MVVSCKKCMAVVDTDNAPFSETKYGPGAGLPAYVQRDVTCPKCGGLLERQIDGKVVTNGPDPRVKVEAKGSAPDTKKTGPKSGTKRASQ